MSQTLTPQVEHVVEHVATTLLNKTVAYRRKLRYAYYHRNARGITRQGYAHLWRIDLDDLDHHLVHIAWRIARWTQTTNTITDLEHLTMSALKFYLKELKAFFRSQRLPKWLFYPVGVNHYLNAKEDYDPSKSEFTAISQDRPPSDTDEPVRLQKALQWAKKQLMKQMKLTRESPEYAYLQFIIGLAQAGLPLHLPMKHATILPHNRVGHLKRQFAKYVREWYATRYAQLIS